MNPRLLAQMMLEWESKKAELDTLEREIKDAVLEMSKTQTVGNVRATYNSGRKSYDYQKAAFDHDAPAELVAQWTTTTVKVDWRAVCGELDIDHDEIPFVTTDPYVTLKLLED